MPLREAWSKFTSRADAERSYGAYLERRAGGRRTGTAKGLNTSIYVYKTCVYVYSSTSV